MTWRDRLHWVWIRFLVAVFGQTRVRPPADRYLFTRTGPMDFRLQRKVFYLDGGWISEFYEGSVGPNYQVHGLPHDTDMIALVQLTALFQWPIVWQRGR